MLCNPSKQYCDHYDNCVYVTTFKCKIRIKIWDSIYLLITLYFKKELFVYKWIYYAIDMWSEY